MIKFLKYNDGALPLFSVIILLLYSVVNVLVSGLPYYQDIFQSDHENYVGWLLWASQIVLVFSGRLKTLCQAKGWCGRIVVVDRPGDNGVAVALESL